MASIGTGRVCMKISGREAGKYCVVLKDMGKDKENKSFVLITGPKPLTGVKRRRCNIDHLEAMEYMIDINPEANDQDVIDAMDKAGLITKLGLKRPSAAAMKVEQKKEEKPKVQEELKEKKDEKKKKQEKK